MIAAPLIAPPEVLPINVAAIPADLRERPQWVGWRWEWVESRDKPGKWTKLPVNARTGQEASSTDPSSWSDFATALAYARVRDLPGIGDVFSADDPFTGVDLDNCRDPETGAIEPWAAAIVAGLDSYTELSPSGTGVHVIVRATKPGPRCTKPVGAVGKIEMYDASRYFTVTGHRLPSAPVTVEARQEELTALYAKTFGVNGHTSTGAAPTSRSSFLSDAELIEKCRAAKNGPAFERLFLNGDTSDYAGDHSVADLALCSILSFWTQDVDQIDRLFRDSALYRPKWDRDDYRSRTTSKALARGEVWQPSGPIVSNGRERAVPTPTKAASCGDGQPLSASTDPCTDIAQALAEARVIIAAQGTEIASLRAEAAENANLRVECDQLRRLQSATMQTFRSRELHAAEKVVGLVSLFETEAAQGHGATDDDGWCDTPLDRIAESAGCSPKVAGKHLSAIATTGVIESRTILRRDPETGAIKKHRQARVPPTGPGDTRPSLTERIARLGLSAPARDPRHAGWGGRRICPDCGDVGTVTTTTIACVGCGQVLSQTTTTQAAGSDPEPVRPADSPMDQDDPSGTTHHGWTAPMGQVDLSSTTDCGGKVSMGQLDPSGNRAPAQEPEWLADAPLAWLPPDLSGDAGADRWTG
jgi:hypothetical protein